MSNKNLLKSLDTVEINSGKASIYFAYSMPGILLALDVFLLYVASTSISYVASVDYKAILATMFVGASFGVLYPFYRHRYETNDDVSEDGEELTRKEKNLLLAIAAGIIFIQSFIFIFTGVNVVYEYKSNPAFYYPEQATMDQIVAVNAIKKSFLNTSIFSMINVVCGVVIDYVLGLRIVVLVTKLRNLEEGNDEGSSKKKKKKKKDAKEEDAKEEEEEVEVDDTDLTLKQIAAELSIAAGFNKIDKTINKMKSHEKFKAIGVKYGNKLAQLREHLDAKFSLQIRSNRDVLDFSDEVKESDLGKDYLETSKQFRQEWTKAASGN